LSLLLKALKQASEKAAGSTRNTSASLADTLSLEPIPADVTAPAGNRWDATPKPHMSATRASWFAPWLSGQRSLVPVIAILAAAFMLVYGGFVYWQTRPVASMNMAQTTPAARSVTPPPVPLSTPQPDSLPVATLLPEVKTLPATQPTFSRPARATAPTPAPSWGEGVLRQTEAAPRRPRSPVRAAASDFSMQPARSEPEPQIERAYQAFQAGQIASARQLYQQVPDGERNLDVQLGLAAIALASNNPALAARHYQRALELDPRNATANAALLNMTGDAAPDASEQRLKTLIATQPSAQLYFTLGNLYATQSRWPDAEHAYFEAFQKNPANADFAYNLAVSLEQISQPKAALSYYQKARGLMRPGQVQFDPARLDLRIAQLSAQDK
jgi:Tfp pilus assembly protein PilF